MLHSSTKFSNLFLASRSQNFADNIIWSSYTGPTIWIFFLYKLDQQLLLHRFEFLTLPTKVRVLEPFPHRIKFKPIAIFECVISVSLIKSALFLWRLSVIISFFHSSFVGIFVFCMFHVLFLHCWFNYSVAQSL